MDNTNFPAREFKMSTSKQNAKKKKSGPIRYSCLNLNDLVELKPYYLSAEGTHLFMLKNIQKKQSLPNSTKRKGTHVQNSKNTLLKTLLKKSAVKT
jgi:hypothetical protein